jgi:type I restriction enzyme S subunit
MELYNYANKWTKINLKDYIVTIESGKRPKGGAVSEGIPSLGGEHIDSSGGFKIAFDKLKYVPVDFYENMKSGIIKKGDILVVKDGATTGKVAYVGEEFPLDEACINEHVFLLRTNEELDGRYLYYYLRSSSGQRNIMNDFRGATVGGISKDFINFDVLLPTLETQKKIVEILERAEKALEKRKEAIKLLDELVKSRFIEMFGDPIKNNKGWDKIAIGDKFQIKTGATPSRKENVYWENGSIPWVKTTELKEYVITETEEYITEEGFNNSSVNMLPKNTILVAMYGQGKTRGMTGKLGIEATTNQACAAILPNEDENMDFIWYQLRLLYNDLRDLGRGGNQPNLNTNLVKGYELIFPPMELQNQFADFVKQVDKLKFEMEKSLKELEDNFNSLMQRAFKGELFN